MSLPLSSKNGMSTSVLMCAFVPLCRESKELLGHLEVMEVPGTQSWDLWYVDLMNNNKIAIVSLI